MMNRILLLTDFSNNALNAIRYAMNLFKHESCEFYVLYVHKAGSFTSADLMNSSKESVYQSITKSPKKKLKKLIDELIEEFGNSKHTFQMSIDFDVFTDAVKQIVKKEGIDYIIIGSNGATSAKEVVFGSNTLNVIRNVNCKTIVIPEAFIYKPIKDLLLVLDSQDTLTGGPYSALLEFLDYFRLKFHVLRVHPQHESSEKALSDVANLSLMDCKYHKIADVPLNYAVSSYLQMNTMDMVALISKPESFLQRFFKGSSTTELSKIVHIPLLILHS